MADKVVVVRLVIRANQFSSGLRGAAAETGKFAAQVERSSAKAGSSALAMGAASATAGKLMLVGIGGALVVSAKAAIDFESSLASVAKTTDLTGSAFAKAGSPLAAFGEALRSLSMRIPLNANELAEIAAMGGQLGIEVPNLIEFTEVMAALGVSTNLGATEAATGLARFANIMGTSHDQFGRLGSIIVDLGNNFATTEAEIMTFGLRLAPIGKTVGMTEEEVFGLSAALTSLGIPAERGGTALQRVFLDMQSAVQSGGDMLTSFAGAARMTREEFQALFNQSPADAFVALVKGLKDIQDAGGSASGVLKDLGVLQQRSIQVLLATANGWEIVADAVDTANTAGAEGNALFVEAGRRYGTSASQIQILSNAFNDLRIEIGNTLLGGGGLAAGLDFMREFFRIIKDNLPMMGNLVKVLAAVAALRIGANLLGPISASITALRSMKGATDGVTRSTAALRLAQLGLSTAVFAAIAIAGVLITRWAAAAAKAAALQQAARNLTEELEGGAEPVAAFLAMLRGEGILTPELENFLNDLGISATTFAEKLLDGDDAFKQLLDRGNIDKLGLTKELMQELMAVTGMTEAEIRALDPSFEVLTENIGDFATAVERGSEAAEGLFTLRTGTVFSGLIEAGMLANHTREELKAMADEAVRFYSLKVPTDSIIDKLSTPELGEGTMGQHPELAAGTGASFKSITLSWEDMVMGMEDGTTKIEDFYESIGEATEDYTTTMEESFAEVRETIMGSFPAWDEYEQMTLEKLGNVIKAQDLYLEDLTDGLKLQTTLAAEGVSGATLTYIEGLDPATKGALSRWRETSKGQFDRWLGEVSENLDEAGTLTQGFWEYELPTAMRSGFNLLVTNLSTQVQALGLPGQEGAQMFIDGLMEQMSLLPEEEQDAFKGYLEELLNNESFLDSLGFNIGDPIILGFLRSLGTMASRARAVVIAEAIKVGSLIDDAYEIKSPSKMTMRVGYELTRGLFKGMDDEFTHQLRASQNPMVNVMGPKPVVNLQTKVQTGSRDIHLYYPQHKNDDVIDGVHKASILSSLQREAEVAIGPG